jgi:CBS domain-containing protein
LCKGGIMAGQPGHCLHRRDWVARIGRWIDRSEPEDLLHAAIYFDMRALAGADALVAPLQTAIARASAAPRFLRALAQNSLRLKPALNWRGAIDVQRNEGRDWVDLKLNGSAIFVDAGRLLMLASGGGEAGGASLYSTRERLLVAGERLRANAAEREAWVSAFEMIQTLRLQAQIDTRHPERPNHIVVADLNDVDRRLLKEALTMARRLQQRIELDLVRA